MTALSNIDFTDQIAKYQIITPAPVESAIQPNSVDLRLGKRFFTVEDEVWYNCSEKNPYILAPLSFVLGSTMEHVNVPAHLRMKIEGKSSWGRMGLSVHQTAGHLDSGFRGIVTLEFFNCTQRPLALVPGSYIAQVTADFSFTPAWPVYGNEKYKSHYQNQDSTVPSYLQGN